MKQGCARVAHEGPSVSRAVSEQLDAEDRMRAARDIVDSIGCGEALLPPQLHRGERGAQVGQLHLL